MTETQRNLIERESERERHRGRERVKGRGIEGERE